MAEINEYEDILKQMLDRVPDDLDKREGSVIYNTLAPAAYIIAQQDQLLAQMFGMLFADTAEGRWLARNAPLYGFILRYPRGKDEITGYAWEPWHIRYVTRSLALYLALTGMTLEEYTQLHAGEECAQTHTGEDTDPGQFWG